MRHTARLITTLATLCGAASVALAIPWPGSPAIQPAAGYATITTDSTSPTHKITVSNVRQGFGVFWVAIYPQAGSGCTFATKSAPSGWATHPEKGAAVWRTNTSLNGPMLFGNRQGSFTASVKGGCTVADYVIHVIDLSTGNTFWTYPGGNPPENHPPVPKTDCINVSVSLGSSVAVPIADLEANFTDVENDLIKFTGIGTATCGDAVIFQDQVVYTPTADCVGQAVKIPYTVSDGTNEVTSYICVTVTNEPPVPKPDCVGYTTTANQTLTIQVADLLANFTDPNGDTLSIVSVGPASCGTATLSADKATVSYVGTNACASATVTIPYTVTDGTHEASSSICITVVEGPPQRPECSGILFFGPDANVTNLLADYVTKRDPTLETSVVYTGITYTKGAFSAAIDAYIAANGQPPCVTLFDTEYIGPNGIWSGLDEDDQARLKALILDGMGLVYSEPTSTNFEFYPWQTGNGDQPQGQLPNVLPVLPYTMCDGSVMYNYNTDLDPAGHPIVNSLPPSFFANSACQDQAVDLLAEPAGVDYKNVAGLLRSSSTELDPWGLKYRGTGQVTAWALDYMPDTNTGQIGGRVVVIGSDAHPGYGDLATLQELYYQAIRWAGWF